MKIYSVKRLTIPKIMVLAGGLAAAVMVATISPQAAVATPRASSCAGCHNPATAGVTTATPSTATPAPGATYTVAITLTANPNGGNTGYGIVPIAPATEKTFGGNTGAPLAFTATMVAPSAAGTYSYTVWTNQGPTDGSAQVGSAVYSITVAAAPVVVTTTTSLAVSPTAGVAPATANLTATVTGAGAAGTVQFLDGTTVLGTSTVGAGRAALVLTGVAAGSYSYTAKFIPTSAAAFTPSTSTAQTFIVTAPVTTPPVTTTTTPPVTSTTTAPPVTSTTTAPPVTTTTAPPVTTTTAPPVTTTTTPPVTSGAKITRLSPDEGFVGTKVTISGAGFGAPGAVTFGGLVAKASSWTTTSIVVTVPGRSSISLRSRHAATPVWYRHDQEVSVTVTPKADAASDAVRFEMKSTHFDD